MGFDATGGKPYQANQDGPLWYLIVLAVVVVSFAAVFFGPGLFEKKTSGLQPVSKIVAGRNLPQAAGAIHSLAFPDPDTQRFLQLMRSEDPEGHAELMTQMAKAAGKGADRDELVLMMNDWTTVYMTRHTQDFVKADAKYLDQGLDWASSALGTLRRAGPKLCDLGSLQRVSQNKDLLKKYTAYGGELYSVGMKGQVLLLEMARAGRNNPRSYDAPTQKDEAALQAMMMSMMADKNVQKIMQAGMSGQSDPSALDGVDVCELGQSVLANVKDLPTDTKARLWGQMASGATLPLGDASLF